MSYWAIGTPGKIARLVLSPCPQDEAAVQLGTGEVAIAVDSPGEWMLGPASAVPAQHAVTAAEAQLQLVGRVKSEAERRKMLSFSAGNGKAQEYVQKGKEAAASASILAATLNALTAASAAAQYPMAHAERILTGETLSAVLARYRAGKAASDAELARLSAIECRAVQAIKGAATAAAKQAAFAAINWNQTV